VSANPLLGAVAVAFVTSCSGRPAWDPSVLGDLAPPVFAGLYTTDNTSVELRFDEPVRLVEGSLVHEPPLPEEITQSSGNSLLVTTPPQTPGQPYVLEATVEDTNGNTAAVLARYWGHNPNVPRILINELTTRGSESHPDLVELRVLTDGDLAGLVLFAGTPSDWTERIVMPSCPVRAGEYVLVHWKPQGIPAEKDEAGARDASGGLDVSAVAVDLWVPGGQGLSGNNGALCLASSPRGEVLDAILYSDRTTDSDTAYGGFGSAVMLARAREMVAVGAWIAANDPVSPEDAVSPAGSTATRTIARGRASVDTNTRADWHITPTRGATWGTANTDDCYAAPVR